MSHQRDRCESGGVATAPRATRHGGSGEPCEAAGVRGPVPVCFYSGDVFGATTSSADPLEELLSSSCSRSVPDARLDSFGAFRAFGFGEFIKRMSKLECAPSSWSMALLRLSSCVCMANKRRHTNSAQNTDKITAAIDAIKAVRATVELLITRS